MKKQQQMTGQQLDIITTIPQAIIDIILSFLPIEEAARTSILSSEWRYKWTTIPKLNFSLSSMNMSPKERRLYGGLDVATKRMLITRKLLCAIHLVLLQRQGPIHEFNLKTFGYDTFVELDQIILQMSRKHTLKKLTLNLTSDFDYGYRYSLPLSVFSLHHLTDLYLRDCEVNLKQAFNGFGSLTSLTLKNISISTEALVRLLSNCPSLKIVSIKIAGLSIIKLFKCLPLVERLTTDGFLTRLDLDRLPGRLPASLIHLKYFCINDFSSDARWDGLIVNDLTLLGVLMKCAPNLEKIKIKLDPKPDDLPFEIAPGRLEEYSVILEGYLDVWLEHLNELEIKYCGNFKLELVIMKFILARSPNLKKVILQTHSKYEMEEVEMLEIMSHAPRPPHASHVEIVVNRCNSYIETRSDGSDIETDSDSGGSYNETSSEEENIE